MTETNFETYSPERLSDDIERIRELAESLLPVYGQLTFDEQGNSDHPLYQELRSLLHPLHPADMATVLESLPLDERILVWKLAAPEDDGEVLLEVSDSVRETLMETMGKEELLAAMEDLSADEVADLAADMPHHVVTEVLQNRDEEEREQIQTALSYEENQVGSIMDFELVSIRADVSCEVVLRYLRRFEQLPDHTDKVFVVDEDDVLQGVLPIRKLLVSDPDALVSEIMAKDVVIFHPQDNTEESAQAFEKYDLITAPVVDDTRHLIGRLTIDAMVDVIREEGEADMLNMAGLQEEEDLFAPVLDSVKNRWVWLAINLCTALVASRVIGLFEGSIEKIVALAALMPIVAGIGGNSGNQTITMIVRALATGQLDMTGAKYLFKKEIGVALANGVIWGSIMGVISYVLYHNLGIGVVMMVAMTLNLILAAVVGVLIPVTLEKMGRDPALGSSVLITAVTDSGGFFIFLGLASIFLLH
ncbi:MAG: magnesium transporter [Neisseriaceae bacterium]|nr:magnesium transporter [Neisseriaceae bacterium]